MEREVECLWLVQVIEVLGLGRGQEALGKLVPSKIGCCLHGSGKCFYNTLEYEKSSAIVLKLVGVIG